MRSGRDFRLEPLEFIDAGDKVVVSHSFTEAGRAAASMWSCRVPASTRFAAAR